MRGFGNYFWGFFLIGVGILLIAKYYFRLSIPTIRVVGGIFFIALGLSWLLGGFRIGSDSDIFFGKGTIHAVQSNREYNIVFSNGVVDLTNIPLKNGTTKVEVNVVFGKGIVKINPNIPTIIEVDGAFSRAETPDGSSISFGEHKYQTGGDFGGNVLRIEASVAFGNLQIVEVQQGSTIKEF